ncbi:MAG: NADP-dependent oxidoreductase [Solirubrobacteraceae bacterium]|nr:NADP-dependent oxidoreductase [Solirubrobacteraceae bacterium]
MPTTAREIIFAQRPVGAPTADVFRLEERELRDPRDGELLVRNLWMSVDPYMRGRMSEAKSYVAGFELDKPLQGDAVGEVLESNAEGFAAGDLVVHPLGWRSHAVLKGEYATKVDPSLAEPQAFLGVLGMPGRTAYAGLTRIAAFKEGDVVFVSGAAGAVGSLVGQLARELGASRVIGSAGGPEKAKHLVDDLGFDAAIDYKAGPVRKALREAAPDGIDVYFDNVGGDHLEAAIGSIRLRGRIAVCGMISGYNATEAQPGPRNLANLIVKRFRIEGFLVSDHDDLTPEFMRVVPPLLSAGKIKAFETVREGLDAAPQAFLDLLTGANTGKMLVKLS